MRFFTADLHLGHAAIIGYCNRPFATVDAMNDALASRWSQTITDADEIWVLGDVALGRVAQTLPLIAALPGVKHLVPGNHDRCWLGHRRVRTADLQIYTDVGFQIHPGSVALTLGQVPVLACHFPVAGDSGAVDRFGDHRPRLPPDAWLVHGHVHDRWRVNGRQINVGVDVWDYRPVSEQTVLELIGSADPTP